MIIEPTRLEAYSTLNNIVLGSVFVYHLFCVTELVVYNILKIIVLPHYNAVFGAHDLGLLCKGGVIFDMLQYLPPVAELINEPVASKMNTRATNCSDSLWHFESCRWFASVSVFGYKSIAITSFYTNFVSTDQCVTYSALFYVLVYNWLAVMRLSRTHGIVFERATNAKVSLTELTQFLCIETT